MRWAPVFLLMLPVALAACGGSASTPQTFQTPATVAVAAPAPTEPSPEEEDTGDEKPFDLKDWYAKKKRQGGKIAECNALIDIINKGVDGLNKPSTDPTGIGDLRTMADLLEKVAADARKTELSLFELQQYSSEYQTMCKAIAESARALAAAAEAKDLAKVQAEKAALDDATKLEGPLVDKINEYCQSP